MIQLVLLKFFSYLGESSSLSFKSASLISLDHFQLKGSFSCISISRGSLNWSAFVTWDILIQIFDYVSWNLNKLYFIPMYKYKIYIDHSTWLAATSMSNGLFVAGFTLRYFSYFNLYIFFTFFCFSPFSDPPLGSRVFLAACRCLLCLPRSIRYKWFLS